MRYPKKIALAFTLISSFAGSAYAKDWGEMNVAERIAWTDEYAGQVCAYGLNVSKKDNSRRNEIASAPQFGVKLWVRTHCNAGPTVSASR